MAWLVLPDAGTYEGFARMTSPEEILHIAVCQVVAILNAAPEVARLSDGRRVRDLLRQALADYSDAVMEQPAKPGEVEHMRKLHRRKSAPSSQGEARIEGGTAPAKEQP
jgi:hypothetical protein